MSQKNKQIKKNFKFDENQLEYTIKLRRKCKWCWLLLLIPLILFIRFNSNIDYVLVDECNIIKNPKITINYTNNKAVTQTATKTPNSKGEVTFKIRGRRIYEIILGFNSPDKYEITANAYDSNTVILTNIDFVQNLKKQKTKFVVNPNEEFIVKVVSRTDTTFNINDATVNLKYYFKEKEIVLNGKTDSLGNCVFKIPACAEEIELYGSKKSYMPDSLEKTDYNTVKQNIDKRKLKLEPKQKKPCKNCRVFVTGWGLDDNNREHAHSEIFIEDTASEFVGAGEYPDNEIAFPKAVSQTFDGIAIGAKTRIIIYSGKNFTGKIVLDKTGPALILNIGVKSWFIRERINTKTFKEPLQTLFPPSVRYWSKTDMHDWSYGSIKIICE